MKIADVWRDMRTLEARRRRALGPAGRIAEQERRIAAINEYAATFGSSWRASPSDSTVVVTAPDRD